MKHEPGTLLRVDGLMVDVRTDRGWCNALNDVSFTVGEREVVGLVGESGSGKSLTGLSILGLLAEQSVRRTGGTIHLDGQALTSMSERELARVRGKDIAMIFQEPMTSLNPALTIGEQIAETVRRHRGARRAAALDRAAEVLDLVGIPNPRQRLRAYPHEFSGGMRQRVMIAMALSCEPRLIIADEPTTALDVTIQAQILDLLRTMQQKMKMSVLFVTHDLGVVAELCDRVMVMYAGQIVEVADAEPLFDRPKMPYTEGLLEAMPQLVPVGEARLPAIPGRPPEPWNMPSGCRFLPRCRYRKPECALGPIELQWEGTERASRCIRSEELDLQGVRKRERAEAK